MEITAVKIDDFTLQIEKTSEPVKTVLNYNINFLLKQREDIQAQKDAFDAARDAELKEIDELLALCEKNNIKSAPG